MSKSRILKKLKNIATGWANYLFPDPVADALARERAQHCEVCPHAEERWYLENLPDDVVKKKGHICVLCNCPLSAKLRVPGEKCPDNPPRWDQVSM